MAEQNVSRYEEIVDAAAELFRAKGYAGTSINDIADAVGLLKGSLYHYINTKEDLLYAIVEEAHHSTASLGEEILALDGDAVAKLRFAIERHLRGIEENLAKVRVFYSEFSRLPSERFTEIIARRDTYERAVRETIRQGQREGVFAAHLDPRLTAASILATLNSVQAWFRPDGPSSMTEIIEAHSDFLLRGLGVETRVERIPTRSGGTRAARKGVAT